MPFEIQYQFKDSKKIYSCTVTYDQYKRFRQLPIVQECNIIKENAENIENYKNEMQEALNQLAKNDTSHILKLSQML